MMEEQVKKLLIEKIESLGLRDYGFMKVKLLSSSEEYFKRRLELGYQTTFEESELHKKIDLSTEMPAGKTIVSIAFPYHFHSEISKEGYFSMYTLGKDYHLVLKEYLEEIASVLRTYGYEAKCFADNNALPERYIAYVSGVGEIGRNHMLITKDYGSKVFLGEIITNLEVETAEKDFREIENYEICGSCVNCIKACPTKILGETFYDTHRCMSYITQNKEVSDEDLKLFKGRLFGCDTCQLVCPLNKDLQTSPIMEFKPRDYMKQPNLMNLVSLSNEEFKKYKETSSGWRGKKLLQRNAMIELMRKGRRIDETTLGTAYLKSYYHRLKDVFKL
jgi:epoxyqueuosine reductase